MDKKIGIIGVLSMIVLALGGNIALTDDQLDKAYICSVNDKIVIAERLSSTTKTAYWIEEGIERSKVCRSGFWLPLKQYAKDNNLDLNIVMNYDSIEDKYLIYQCDQTKCEVI